MIRRRLDLVLHGSDGYTSTKRLVALVAIVGFLAVGGHMALKSWYSGRIMPGVVAAGQQLGNLTVEEARAVLRQQAESYKLDLTVAGQKYQLTAAQLGAVFDPEATLTAAYGIGRSGWLPYDTSEPVPMAYRMDRTVLTVFAASVTKQVGTKPVDAGVVFENGQFKPVADKTGVTVNAADLVRLIEADLRSFGGSLALRPKLQLADIRVGQLGPTIDEAQQLIATPVVLTFEGRTFTPTQRDIGRWVTFEKQPGETEAKLVPKVNQGKLKSYIGQIARQLDIAPVTKRMNVENGIERVGQEGKDGRAINQEPVMAAITEAVTKNQPLTFVLTARVVPFQIVSTSLTSLDIARYIEVDISKQRLWVWQDKRVIYETPVTTGATGAGFATATGMFSIYSKQTNRHLRGYRYGWDYDVFVKYWMPFYQGYGLHDASWRHGKFGGQDYYYNGSHGCVNLPDAAAAFIYNWAAVGTPVWVHP